MASTQFVILLSAAIAIAMISSSAPATLPHRVGCWIGLAGQPFWLYETMHADQFGMFVVSLWFTGVYLFGAFRPRPASPTATPTP